MLCFPVRYTLFDARFMANITPIRMARFAMRTRFEIVLWDARRDPADLQAAAEEALQEVTDTESLLSAYRPDASLFLLNQQLAFREGTYSVPPQLAAFLANALSISSLTDKAFDPTLGDAAYVTVDATNQTITTTRPGVRFDPGAIGKGYALDRARDALREAGVRNALLHGGTSSVTVLGNEPGKDGWGIAIASPVENNAPATVWTLRDGDSLGVSANHGRLDHVRDPRSGSSTLRTQLAAVLTRSATLADALSTALLVVDPEGRSSLRETFPEVREWFVLI